MTPFNAVLEMQYAGDQPSAPSVNCPPPLETFTIRGASLFFRNCCHATFKTLKERGVEVLREPEERFYGIEALFRDPFGNWFSLTERNRD
ncbi:MAG TPA: VOC family protein [Chthoniobacterales bacterium]|nr:VOC family protein [Chthoniobacterales bacterium]